MTLLNDLESLARRLGGKDWRLEKTALGWKPFRVIATEYNAAASPSQVLKLIQVIRLQNEALGKVALQTEMYHDASQPNWVMSHRPTKFARVAMEALSTVTEMLGEK